MRFGLSDFTIDTLTEIFQTFPEIEKVVLYGSRAKGNFREGSDIDITLFGDNLEDRTASNLLGKLDDSVLPYLFDVSIFDNLTNENLKDHIKRVGKVLYQRKKDAKPL